MESYAFVIANGICKRLCLRLFPELSEIAHIVDITTTQQNNCSGVEQLKKEHTAFTSLARGLTSSKVIECLLEAVMASSTDYPGEGIENTVEPVRSGNIALGGASYWSSSGNSNPEGNETLTYELLSDFCVVSEINIRPFEAHFEPSSPIYSAKAVRFRMGLRVIYDVEEDTDFSEGHVCHPFIGEYFEWTYTSPVFPMAQVNQLQSFKLPKPVLCIIGGLVQIELMGRVQRQEMDGKFYIRVTRVQVQGRPLAPVFSVDFLQPSGKFLLNFNPQAKFSFLRNIRWW